MDQDTINLGLRAGWPARYVGAAGYLGAARYVGAAGCRDPGSGAEIQGLCRPCPVHVTPQGVAFVWDVTRVEFLLKSSWAIRWCQVRMGGRNV